MKIGDFSNSPAAGLTATRKFHAGMPPAKREKVFCFFSSEKKTLSFLRRAGGRSPRFV
jgi:hypothetical protein